VQPRQGGFRLRTIAVNGDKESKKESTLAKRRVARLVPRGKGRPGKAVRLNKEVITLGRGEGNDVIIDDQLASRRHARVCWDGARFVLEDLDSTNGTFVNEQRISGPMVLKPGDEIRIANATFEFVDPEATVAEAGYPRMVIDEVAGSVWVNRRPVQLSAKEYALLIFLYHNAGRVCSKDEIGQAVWPEYEGMVFDYQVESLVKRVRQKIEPDPAKPAVLLTIRGRGYKLIDQGR
jgi:hypothetical protein